MGGNESRSIFDNQEIHMAQTLAGDAIEAYYRRLKAVGRTRWAPTAKDAKTERDPELPGVTFYRYPDGSMVRMENGCPEEC